MIGINGIWYSFTGDPEGIIDYEIFDIDKLVIEGTGTFDEIQKLFDDYVKKTLN